MSKNCCEYCKDSSRKRLEDKSEGFYSVRSYLEIGEQTTLVYDDSNDGTIKRTYGFQYCPMCGRYLREEEQQKFMFEKQFEANENEKDRASRERIAAIRAAGYSAAVDINENERRRF